MSSYSNLEERRAHLRTVRWQLSQDSARQAEYNEYQEWLWKNPQCLWADEIINGIEADEGPDSPEKPQFIHPNLPHLDVICDMWFGLREDGLSPDDVQFTPYARTEQPPAEQVMEWVADSVGGVRWFDIGAAKHHVTGETSSIAYARKTRLLLEMFPYLEELVQMVDLNDQTGCLKVGNHPLARIIREAYKVGVPQEQVIKMTMRWLDTYAEVAKQGLVREEYQAESERSKIVRGLIDLAGKKCRPLSLHEYLIDMRLLKTNAYVVRRIAMEIIGIGRKFKALKAKVPAEFEQAVRDERFVWGQFELEDRSMYVHTLFVGGLETHETLGGYTLGTTCPPKKRAHVVIVWTGTPEKPGRYYIFTRKGRGEALVDISDLYAGLIAGEAVKRGISGPEVMEYVYHAEAFNAVMNGSAALCDTQPTFLTPKEVFQQVCKYASWTELGLKVVRPKRQDDRKDNGKGKPRGQKPYKKGGRKQGGRDRKPRGKRPYKGKQQRGGRQDGRRPRPNGK